MHKFNSRDFRRSLSFFLMEESLGASFHRYFKEKVLDQ